ncbi:MAG: phosphoribosylamine--glycine ligase [Candidatus Neomarinimicrobiota bacterium]
MEKILVLGSGAREHSIIKAIERSSRPNEVFCVASNMNPGIASLCSEFIIDDFNNAEIVTKYAIQNDISLAIVGPENPLQKGVADALWNAKIKVVGPKKEPAQIETSKAFTRNLLKKYKIPGGPKYKIFNSMVGVISFLKELGDNYVVKFDGLAGGKGVKVSGDHLNSHEDALQYCEELINKNHEFVIEEKFIGEEFSLMSFCDGKNLKHMPAVQDHKRAYENDLGPNTGGMGTYSDADHSLPFLQNEEIQKAQDMNQATANALMKEFGYGFKGVLYGGFMATKYGVKLIEYNARFGDPEAMNVLSILETDFIDICDGITQGTLDQIDVRFKNKATVCKYAVPEGYPEKPIKGAKIDLSKVEDQESLFYASVDIVNGDLIEAGSRTVAVVGVDETIEKAEKLAQREISKIKGPLFYRKDIGTNKLIQEKTKHMESLR